MKTLMAKGMHVMKMMTGMESLMKMIIALTIVKQVVPISEPSSQSTCVLVKIVKWSQNGSSEMREKKFGRDGTVGLLQLLERIAYLVQTFLALFLLRLIMMMILWALSSAFKIVAISMSCILLKIQMQGIKGLGGQLELLLKQDHLRNCKQHYGSLIVWRVKQKFCGEIQEIMDGNRKFPFNLNFNTGQSVEEFVCKSMKGHHYYLILVTLLTMDLLEEGQGYFAILKNKKYGQACHMNVNKNELSLSLCN